MSLLKSIADPFNMMGGGLLWKPLKKATGLTDAQMIGVSAAALAGAPHVVPAITGSGAAAPAAGAAEGGVLSTFGQYAQPASQVMNIASQAHGMSQGQQMQAPPAQFAQGQGFGGLLNVTDQYDPRKRQQAQQVAVQGLLNGYGGRYG